MESAHYDKIYLKKKDKTGRLMPWLRPPEKSPYYPVWRSVLTKHLEAKCKILDVGCGPGQFAKLCINAGHPYEGVDFSKEAVKIAKKLNPTVTFHVVDVVKNRSLIAKGDYDTITFMQFLEHIKEDLEVLESIPEGKNVVLSVPKFWSKGHVRVFNDLKAVYSRYRDLLEITGFDDYRLGDAWDRPLPSKKSVRSPWVVYLVSGIRRNLGASKESIKPSNRPRILILTPFRNEAHSIPQYLRSLCSVDYPSKLIDVFWLHNDSTDGTLKMLEKAKPRMTFHSTTLKSIRILGPIKKGEPKSYWKDIRYGIKKRGAPWLVIWNKQFLPLIRKSKADYVLTWFADAVAPPNVIKAFLEVFKVKKDAGWVGGANYYRYPRQKKLGSPSPIKLAKSKKIVRAKYIGHCWMCPRAALGKTCLKRGGRDIHMSLIKGLARQGLHVYYQPKVFLKHISNDGKIYRTKL